MLPRILAKYLPLTTLGAHELSIITFSKVSLELIKFSCNLAPFSLIWVIHIELVDLAFEGQIDDVIKGNTSAVRALLQSLTLIPSLEAKVLTAAVREVRFSHHSGADGTDVLLRRLEHKRV